MENRRLFIAVFLSAMILIIWNSIFPPVPPSPIPPDASRDLSSGDPQIRRQEDPAAASESGLAHSPYETTEAGEPSQRRPSLEEESLIDFEEDVVASEVESRSILESDVVRLEFSNRGAQLVSFRLKQHATSGGESLELVRDRGSDPYPFGLVVGGERSHRLNNALFVSEAKSDERGETLRFRHRSSRGAAEKLFRLTPEGLVSVEITVLGEDWSLLLGPGLRNLNEKELGDRLLQREVGYRRGESLETIAPHNQEGDEFIPSVGLRWVTLEDNFFLVAAMPRSGVREVVVRPVLQLGDFAEGRPRFLPIGSEAEGASTEQMLLLQASGPQMELLTLFGDKRYSRLVKLPYELEGTVRWGWFGFLARPLYLALEWIYRSIVPNYGWAIVLVTCLIKLIFLPLTFKSQESMSRMQELNPKVQAIKNKYRNKLKDRQGRPNAEASRQMNEEVMKLYKSAGVNPLSGCLPALLQMPVFFAFFRLLSTAVELRNAPWIGWIKDLSVADPIFVLPLVMGATSIGLQRMMPTSPDPIQRRMFQLLPIMFTFFALYFPSGLVLYWITNNVLSMAQQAMTVKLKERREAAG